MRLSTTIAALSFLGWVAVTAFIIAAPMPSPAVPFLIGLVTTFAIYWKLNGLDEVVDTIDDVSKGKFDRPTLAEDGSSDLRTLAVASNQLRIQFEESTTRARELASGRVGAVAVEEKVLRSGTLSDGDLPSASADRPLETSMVELTNHMRRLALQARIVARDQLHSPLLDERVPGELGDAFALMVRNLRSLTDRAKEIADGRLTRRLEGDGDLTSAFNLMIERHEVLSKEVVQTALHISSSAEEILSVLREQEFAASHQASSVEETQRTMETLLSSAKRIAESAQTVFKSAERTQANNRTVAERIGELKTHTERIGEILEGIKSIADRSDLLALNASLEGMRAGEAGKGFTLVAAEMRRLAENIKASVADIKELLSDIRESALSSVMATEEGTNLSERTTESALKITLITQQQQSGTEQVTQSMDELSSLINQGVAGMRQVTTASGELVHMSEDLRVIVEQFRSTALQTGSAEYPSVRPIRKRITEPTSGEMSTFPATTTQSRRSSTSDDLEAVPAAPSDASGEVPVERQTISLIQLNEDPPTLELAGLSEEEERDMLARALRSRSATRPGMDLDGSDADE